MCEEAKLEAAADGSESDDKMPDLVSNSIDNDDESMIGLRQRGRGGRGDGLSRGRAGPGDRGGVQYNGVPPAELREQAEGLAQLFELTERTVRNPK